MRTSGFKPSFAIGVVSSVVLSLAVPVRAVAQTLTTGDAVIGTNTSNYGGVWKTGVSPTTGFAISTNGTDTIVNAPVTTGAIYLRQANNASGGNRVKVGSTAIDVDCSSGVGNCLDVTTTVGGGYAVEGTSLSAGGLGVRGIGGTGNAVGVYGSVADAEARGVEGVNTTGTAIWGHTNSGAGVHAESATGNGLVASNTRLDHAAAVVSALSGGDSGLAYWGTGAIIITGTAQKPGGGSWDTWSDARVKKDVVTFRKGLAELLKIRPVNYKFNGLGGTSDNGKEYVGVIAQELEKVLPAMITSRRQKLRPADKEEIDLRVLDPSAFTYVLINAVQEQQTIIDRQEATLARQEARLERLERGGGSVLSSAVTGNLGLGLVLGLMPIGIAVGCPPAARKVCASARLSDARWSSGNGSQNDVSARPLRSAARYPPVKAASP